MLTVMEVWDEIYDNREVLNKLLKEAVYDEFSRSIKFKRRLTDNEIDVVGKFVSKIYGLHWRNDEKT